MKKDIKFSFIVPNYNKGEYINECLNSIFNQTYKNFEVIVVDDGSTDNSLEEIKKFPITELLFSNRVQAGGARNLGLKHTTGDYIVYLDSDDFLANNEMLEKLANTINDEDLIFLNYFAKKGDILEETIDIEGDLSKKIESTRFLGCPTKCYKRTLIESIQFPECKRYEDMLFTLEALCKTKSYTSLREPFFVYRIVRNGNAYTPIDEKTMLDIYEELIKMYRLCLKYPEYKEPLLNRLTKDRMPLRIEVIHNIIKTGVNNYKEFF